eukprot:jgi/Ulvmu1/8535/UM044_0069.1
MSLRLAPAEAGDVSAQLADLGHINFTVLCQSLSSEGLHCADHVMDSADMSRSAQAEPPEDWQCTAGVLVAGVATDGMPQLCHGCLGAAESYIYHCGTQLCTVQPSVAYAYDHATVLGLASVSGRPLQQEDRQAQHLVAVHKPHKFSQFMVKNLWPAGS